MTNMQSEDYQAGLRDGRLESLESTVRELTREMSIIKKSMWMLYGAIGLVGILPKIIEIFTHAPG